MYKVPMYRTVQDVHGRHARHVDVGEGLEAVRLRGRELRRVQPPQFAEHHVEPQHGRVHGGTQLVADVSVLKRGRAGRGGGRGAGQECRSLKGLATNRWFLT